MDNLSKDVKKVMEQINIPEEKLNQAVLLGVQKAKREKKLRIKKWSYVCSVAVLMFGLFLGSASVSPTMAKIVSKIPLLGQIFYSDADVGYLISEKLEDNGYKSSIQISSINKEINIKIKDPTDDEQKRKKVAGIAQSILDAKQYDAYSVTVASDTNVSKGEPMKDEDVQKESEKFQSIDAELRKELKQRNIEVWSIMSMNNPNSLVLTISDTETRTDEIRQIANGIFERNQTSISLDIKKVELDKKKQESRWADIVRLIQGDLKGKKEYKVRTVGFTVNPEPTILVHLSISNEDDGAKSFAKELEKVINDSLGTEQIQQKIKNDNYKIEIYNSEEKKLN
ncbi:DUF4030 domain-containing protein [Rossellomorea sp. SC111]|uniref:DUF4030 domain-containing protein n=1 Tax=Rossellomorea sp. SC111 TaxID=2968985 RepID=UPI00215B7027|nr:DUF4030 domain-containing protein [Rossellomorea sp. SC111]MCR8847773.1 DUF4030 domain-containing protein [Rossellomorea sp. SC111]